MNTKTKWIIGMILFIFLLAAIALCLAPAMYKAYLSIEGGKIQSVDLQTQMSDAEFSVPGATAAECEAIPDTQPAPDTDFEITNCYLPNAARPYAHACVAYTEQGTHNCEQLCHKKVAIKESCSYGTK